MNPLSKLVLGVGVFSALQGLVLATGLALIGGPAARLHRALALLVVNLSMAAGSISLEHSGWLQTPIHALLVEYTVCLTFPPLLWRYSSLVLGQRERLGGWIHFLPALAWLLYLLAYGSGWTSIRFLPPVEALVVYMASYTGCVAIRVIRGARRGSTLLHQLEVLKLGAALLIAVHAAQFVRMIFSEVAALRDVVPITAAGAVFWLSTAAFRQSRLFSKPEAEVGTPKYVESLTEDEVEQILLRLERCMKKDRPYLNEGLTLAELARRIKVPRADLSRAINLRLGVSFPELVNQYRVRAATQLLEDPASDHLTIESIGYEVGFRSRSAFHNAYKRLTGETPGRARDRRLTEGPAGLESANPG